MFRSCFAKESELSPSSEKSWRPASVSFSEDVRERVLLEVVGAMGLSSIKGFVNSYCTVEVNDKTVHRTSIVKVRRKFCWYSV